LVALPSAVAVPTNRPPIPEAIFSFPLCATLIPNLCLVNASLVQERQSPWLDFGHRSIQATPDFLGRIMKQTYITWKTLISLGFSR
jgi:hypothetical protein